MKLGQDAELQERLVKVFFFFFKMEEIYVHFQMCSIYCPIHQELYQVEPSPALYTPEHRQGDFSSCEKEG